MLMMKITTLCLGGRDSTSLLYDNVWKIVFFIVVCSFVTGTKGCKNCTSLRSVQVECKTSNDILLQEAEKFQDTGNSSSFCSSLFDFYYCIGENVPECLMTMQEQYSLYYQSPYDCHLSREITLRLQTYLKTMCIRTTEMSKTSSLPPESKGQLSTTIIISTLGRGTSTSKRGQVNPSNSSFKLRFSSHVIAWCFLIPYMKSKGLS